MTRTRRVLVSVTVLSLGVATFATGAIKFKPSKTILVDGQGVAMKEPYGVGCGTGVVVVADAGNQRLLVLEAGERGLVAKASLALAEIHFPVRVDVARTGEFLVLDGRSRRIGRVAPDGTFKGWLDIAADDAKRPIEIRSFAVGPDGAIFVLDVSGGRVLVTDEQGRVSRTVLLPEDRGFPSDLAVDRRGDLYVLDSVKRRVDAARGESSAAVALSGPLAQDLDFATSIVADGEGNLFLVDEHGSGVVIVGRDGSFRGRQLSMGWREGFLRYPSDACVTATGEMIVADRGNNRVQVFEIAQ